MTGKSASGSEGGIQITPEEMERFKESMKNDEFKKLFFDYMNEISDPNNKKLYEEELAKLEGEKGWKVRYVKPQPHYCLKTWIASASPQDTGKGNQTFPQKCFVNICSSTEINVPAESKTMPGKWDIPYSLANGRTDVDHELKECKVYDVVFHPQALEKSYLLPAFKTLLSKTALEGLSRQFSIVFDKTKGYKVLVNMKSKGAPLMTMIREKDESAGSSKEEEVEKETSLDFIQKLATSMSSTPTTSTPSSSLKPAQLSNAAEESARKPEKLAIPDFKIIHQQKFNDYQKFAGSSGHETRKDFGSRPDALVIKISLPLVASAALVDVDFTPDGLGLDLHVPDLYKLHLDLPFPVVEEESKAQFDKKSRMLSIEVPVVPAAIVKMPAPADDVPIERDDKGEEEKEDLNETLKGSALVSEISEEMENLKLEKKQEEQIQERKDDVDNLASALESTTLEPSVSLPVYHTLPPFQASQSPGSISFIIPVSGINDSSLVTARQEHDINSSPSIASSLKLDFTASHGEVGNISYSLHLGFQCDFLEFEVSVTPVNLCLLVIKKGDGMWKNIWVGSASKSGSTEADWEERVLVLPETIPEIEQQSVADSLITVEAKQRKDLVVIEATKTASKSNSPSTSGSVTASANEPVKKPVFVNSALFELDD